MTLSQWRDIAIVILAVEFFIISLVPAALCYLAIRGTSEAIKKTRLYGPVVQGHFRKAAEIAERGSQRIAGPFISLSAAKAQAQRTVSSAVSSPKDPEGM